MIRWTAPSRAVTLLLVAAAALPLTPTASASAPALAARTPAEPARSEPAPAEPATAPAPGDPVPPVPSDAAPAPAAHPVPSEPAPAAEPVPSEPLVPGVEGGGRAEYPMDTPDQVLPPVPQDGVVVPVPEPEEVVDELVEYMPRSALAAACTALAGPHQRRVEQLLKLKVDGKQSAADCKAIRAFQVKEKIKPAAGYAGPVTWARAELLAARKNPNAAGKCPVKTYTVVCVDLDRELMWVQKKQKVTFPVVNMRSGRPGYRTRTGWKTIYWRNKDHWSSLYNTPMPYSQFFDGGQAFHAVYGQLATPTGSRGCVNLSHANAKKLWDVLRKGDRVYIWGKRPER
ncbi:L,D-transpeptidase family protein [Streptomyces sp. NPDC048370]|uniref:L,D-transpeptidase family protein n=1 Tax=Streptomyces sp. NPDC048370 TaxID=3365540 RepID=UPI003717F1F0